MNNINFFPDEYVTEEIFEKFNPEVKINRRRNIIRYSKIPCSYWYEQGKKYEQSLCNELDENQLLKELDENPDEFLINHWRLDYSFNKNVTVKDIENYPGCWGNNQLLSILDPKSAYAFCNNEDKLNGFNEYSRGQMIIKTKSFYLSSNPKLTPDFVLNNELDWDYNNLLKNPNFPPEFFSKGRFNFNRCVSLTEKFIEDHSELSWDYEQMRKMKNISPEFLLNIIRKERPELEHIPPYWFKTISNVNFTLKFFIDNITLFIDNSQMNVEIKRNIGSDGTIVIEQYVALELFYYNHITYEEYLDFESFIQKKLPYKVKYKLMDDKLFYFSRFSEKYFYPIKPIKKEELRFAAKGRKYRIKTGIKYLEAEFRYENKCSTISEEEQIKLEKRLITNLENYGRR